MNMAVGSNRIIPKLKTGKGRGKGKVKAVAQKVPGG
jgi:hypothetical protein